MKPSPDDVPASESTPSARLLDPRWKELIVVCARCARRAGEKRKKKRDRLLQRLKTWARETGPRKDTRVAKTSCLGICPKGHIVVGLVGNVRPLRLALASPEARTAEVVGLLRTGDGDEPLR